MQTTEEVAALAVAILRGQVRSGMLRGQPTTERIVRGVVAAYDGLQAVERVQAIRDGECVIERARRGHA